MKYLLLILTTFVFVLNLAVGQEETSSNDYFSEGNVPPKTKVEKEETPPPSKKIKRTKKDEYAYQFDVINAGDADRVASMYKDSIDYYRKNQEGQSALTLAIKNQDAKTVEVLTKRAVINLKNEDGETPLTLAIKGGNTEIIKLVARRAKASLKNNTGEAPLFLALDLDDLYLLEELIRKGADVNRKSNGVTPLARAAELNKPKIVAFLIKNKAKINQTNDNGETPLYIAVQKGFDTVAGILINKSEDASGDCNWENKIGTPLLHVATESGNAEIVRILIRYGAEIEKADYMENTALCAAAQLGQVEVVRALIQNNANINHQNLQGDTPLILASVKKHDEVVTLLLENGADATILNYTGYAAADFYSEKIVNGLFAERGAKLSIEKNNTTNTNKTKDRENNQ